MTAVAFFANRPRIASCTGWPAARRPPAPRRRAAAGSSTFSAFMRARTAKTRSTGLSMPIGSTSGARPKRLPSCQACSSGRRLTGTIARISLPVGIVALVAQPVADRAGDAGEQHVVDRAAERLADRLDLVERDRLAPGDALAAARLALEQGRRVVGHQRQRGDVAEHLGADARAVDRAGEPLLRIGQRLERARDRRLDQRRRLRREAAERLQHRVGEPVAAVASASPCARRSRARRVAAAVGDRHHHRDQRDAVADAVVDARDQRAAALVALDQVELPERPVGIQRRRRQLADALLQRVALALPLRRASASRARRGGGCRSPRRRPSMRRRSRRARPPGGSARTSAACSATRAHSVS